MEWVRGGFSSAVLFLEKIVKFFFFPPKGGKFFFRGLKKFGWGVGGGGWVGCLRYSYAHLWSNKTLPKNKKSNKNE